MHYIKLKAHLSAHSIAYYIESIRYFIEFIVLYSSHYTLLSSAMSLLSSLSFAMITHMIFSCSCNTVTLRNPLTEGVYQHFHF